MQDELAGPPITDVHACFTELVEGRGDVARARFGAAVLAAAEALLAEHRALEAAAVPEPASGLRTAAPAVAGLEFDGLAITRLLGRGAMSEVWEARELAAGRLVAVKLLPPELDTAISARLHRETLALASLEHPGIARLYRHGIVRDGGAMRRYIAMELVRGARTLSEWRAEAPRTRAECVRIVAGVARLLQDDEHHRKMARAHNPFGDGQASGRILAASRAFLDARRAEWKRHADFKLVVSGNE
jgi:hypothetical protein